MRAAYDWLVANYHDGTNPDKADEIYIFGFSRGAYTARSLVGFIATCGLVRRGAPLSVNELWDDYCILSGGNENIGPDFGTRLRGKIGKVSGALLV